MAGAARMLARMVLAAGLWLGGTSMGCAEMVDVSVTAEDSGRPVAVRVGQNLLVKLPDLGGAGFSWQVAGNNRAVLEPGEPRSETSPGASGGVRIFPFKALKPGRLELTFTSSRPWERDRPPAQKVTFNVTVTESH